MIAYNKLPSALYYRRYIKFWGHDAKFRERKYGRMFFIIRAQNLHCRTGLVGGPAHRPRKKLETEVHWLVFHPHRSGRKRAADSVFGEDRDEILPGFS